MTEGWAYGGAPQSAANPTITLVEGVTFGICGRRGDITPGSEQGLFYKDTRFLSRYELHVDGRPLDLLAVEIVNPFGALFIGRRPPRAGTADSTLLVTRRRFVGNGMVEDIAVRNLGREPAGVSLDLFCDTDFAGLFEVKEGRVRHREGIGRSSDESGVHMSYQFGADSRGLLVAGSDDPNVMTGQLSWRLVVAPREEQSLTVRVVPVLDGQEAPPQYPPGKHGQSSKPAIELETWRAAFPAVETPDERLTKALRCSAEDLGSLRIVDPDHPKRVVIAAGAPWFMTLFGRDSLLTSWMLLPVDPRIALGTLHMLAQLQGEKTDPLSEEQPGRILHEVRTGLDAGLELGGGNVYYGSIDATALFVMLVAEVCRWGFHGPEIDSLLPNVDRAMEWIEHYGDRDGDGFVEYQRATDRGLLHQGWKDSFDAINFSGGRLAEPPIAPAEVQGYVYAAFTSRAYLAEQAGDHKLASEWLAKADDLKRRFNDTFWLPDRGYYALALDGDKQAVDSLASNMGHCLWAGIVDEDKAGAVAEHLRSHEMFTGFGVRTLATSMGAYNPMSYHNGSVWPHDNAIIGAGLMRYGFVEDAQRIALGMIDAAGEFSGRLPELFCGFERGDFPAPVPYPTSCSPQAWASATPLLLLRTLLRLDPAVPGGRVWCDPAVPDQLLPLRAEGLHLAGRGVSVRVDADGWEMTGLPAEIEIVREPRPALVPTQEGIA